MSETEGLFRQAQEQRSVAYSRLLQRMSASVAAAAHRVLNRKQRCQVQPSDVAQSVMKSFFARRHSLKKFATAQQLRAFLCQMARFRVIQWYRYGMVAEARSLNRVESLGTETKDQLPAATPSPTEQVAANERWSQMLAACPPHHRMVLQMKLEGYAIQEIARTLGIATRTVQRVIRRAEGDVE